MSNSNNLFVNNNNNNNNNNNSNSNSNSNKGNKNTNKYTIINNNEYNTIAKKMSKVENSYYIGETGKKNIIKQLNEKIYELLKLYNYNNNNINKTIKSLSNENKLKINNLSTKNNILKVIQLLKIIKILKKDKPRNKEFINKNQINKIQNLNQKNKLKIIKILKGNNLYKKNLKNKVTMFFNKGNILNELSSNNKKLINELLKIAKKVKKNKLEKIANVKKMNKLREFNDNNNINSIRQKLSNKNKVNISKISKMVNGVYKYLDFLQPDIKEIFKTKFKGLIINNIEHIPNKYRKFEYQSEIFNLEALIYDSSIPGNFKINKNSEIGKGGYAKVYKNIHLINKNNTKILPYVFKIIQDKPTHIELKSLFFNICFLALLYLKNNIGIKYFCDLYEFGEIIEFRDLNKSGKKVNKYNSFYAIMENGGKELYKYVMSPNMIFITKLRNTLIIIKECAEAIQVLHHNDMIHCDIKLENFLIKETYRNCNIKIIDFGFSRKNETFVRDLFGTYAYIPSDFFYAIYNKLNYKITVKNDIYALGIMFIELLFKIFYEMPTSTFNSDLKKKINHNSNTLKDLNIIINKIINTNIEDIIDKLKISLKNNNIFIERLETILRKITYLVGCYTNLSEFITEIDELLELLK
jgi:hypothetical protein